jgi:hypothetical protein
MNNFNFIIKEFPSLESIKAVDENVIFSISINDLSDIKRIDLNTLHSGKLYQASNFNLSICFNFTNNVAANDKLIAAILESKNFLLQVFFHPKFLKRNGLPAVFVFQEGGYTEAVKKFMNDLASSFFSRGLDGLECIYFNAEDDNSNLQGSIIYEYRDNASFEKWYYKLLTQKYYLGNYLSINRISNKLITDIVKLKKTSEENFKSSLPHQYQFSQKFILLKTKTPALESKLKQNTEDLENHKKYLTIVKQQDEAIKINNFYHNEYEILPTWYKKLGHIIKVLQGKRAFRSLYDSNVKKYKN